jgi:hypothetical protein
MAMTKEYGPERDGPKKPRPPMFGKPMPKPMPRPSMPSKPMPGKPIPQPNMPGKPIPQPSMPGVGSQEQLKKAARGAAIMKRMS